MKELLENLSRLQSFDFAETESADAESQIAGLRAKIPAQILGHYDRLIARGKKGIVPVRNQICSGCHMRVPLGVILTLQRGDDIQVCDCCGRYLFLELEKPAAEQKRKRRSKKTVAAQPDVVAV